MTPDQILQTSIGILGILIIFTIFYIGRTINKTIENTNYYLHKIREQGDTILKAIKEANEEEKK